MTNRETWLSTIRANPSDWQAMLAFSDWLEDTEGDLLAAEQWRWIACIDTRWRLRVLRTWPEMCLTPGLMPDEIDFANKNNIRCMPTYPLTIEDVQRHFDQLETV